MIKSHRGACKRLLSRSKSYKRGSAGRSHLNECKSTRRLRQLRKGATLNKTQAKLARLLTLR